MSIRKVIQLLTVLVGLHQELLNISKEKTEIIKDGKIDELQQVLVQERKLVRKLDQAETERSEHVDTWLRQQQLEGIEPTITNILEHIEQKTERDELEQTAIQLTRAITDLKAQEKLNMALLNQSMQFVQVSLDLLSPSLKNLNYSNKSTQNQPAPNRSIFDSKA